MRAISVAMLLVIMATAVLVVIGSPKVAGTALAADRIDTGFTGAVTIKQVTTGSPDRPDTTAAVAAVLTDLNIFWSATLPADFGKKMTPLAGGYEAVDSSAASLTGASALCITSPSQITGNAYYCPSGDGIIYDSAALVPVLLGHYGTPGLIAAFGHEFGHSIQARIGPTAAQRSADPDKYPSILIEAQGDCFAGAFLAWVVSGSAPHLHLSRDALVQAIAPLLDFADPVNVSVTDPAAHGLALDRMNSILLGLGGGAIACHAMTRASLTPTLARPGLSDQSSTPRFSSQAAVLEASTAQLSTFIATLPAGKGGSTSGVTPKATDLAAAQPFGQFAIAATQALADGRVLTGTDAGAACFTGAYTASVFGHAASGALGSWAGDADEAVNMLRARPGATIDELIGFDNGFDKGWADCGQ